MCLSWNFCSRAVDKPVPYAESKLCSRSLTVEVGIVSLLSYISRHSKVTLANGHFFLEYTEYNNQDSHYSSLYVLCVCERSFKDVNDAQMHKIEV